MKTKKKMTPEEAEHILLNMGDYIVLDKEYGFLFKAPLIDATLLAIKALRAQTEVDVSKLFRPPVGPI